ncbi:MAG: hypothetical protein PHQ60_16410 [Sideroxydans sp.]|nr:hypothetical protein [Sideroxydans sp.]
MSEQTDYRLVPVRFDRVALIDGQEVLTQEQWEDAVLVRLRGKARPENIERFKFQVERIFDGRRVIVVGPEVEFVAAIPEPHKRPPLIVPDPDIQGTWQPVVGPWEPFLIGLAALLIAALVVGAFLFGAV